MRGAGARVRDVNTMSAMFLHRLAKELDRHKTLTMAEANLKWETAKVDFENLLLDSDIQGYLFEPEFSQEELRERKEEDAAAAAEQALPVAEDEEPERAGLLCSPIDTYLNSIICP